MPQLANIFPAAGQAPFSESETTALPNAGQTGAESFDDVMSRAQSPRQADVAAAQNRRLRTSIAGAQKRNPVDSSQPLTPVKAGEDSPAIVKIKAAVKADDQHGKYVDLFAQAGAGVIADASQNPAIPVPAPALSAWSLNLSVPATSSAKSAANNPMAAAVTPLGVAEKTGAALVKNLPAPKIDLPADNLSATALKLSVLAGTVAGDSASPKMELVPAGDAQTGDSIILQNSVAVAVIPFGIAEKTGAAPVKNPPAPKPDLQTSALSGAALKLSVLAGTAAGDSASPKMAAVSAGDAQTDDSIALQNAAAEYPAPESAAHAPAKSHGTPVARQDVPMKNTEQTNKVAGQAEKVLPGNVVLAARENILPGRGVSIPAPARGERLEANVANLTVAPDRAADGPVPTDESVAVSNVSGHGARTLDRTHELVSLHALRLVDAKSDLLQVVLKPGAGTQLSLELRQRGGSIEAQAVLQAGDFEHLKQHWPDLQQRLEQRGIRLAPLTSDENFTGGGSQGFQNQRNPPVDQESFPVGTFAGFVPVGAKNILPEEPAIQAASSRGWQTWA